MISFRRGSQPQIRTRLYLHHATMRYLLNVFPKSLRSPFSFCFECLVHRFSLPL